MEIDRTMLFEHIHWSLFGFGVLDFGVVCWTLNKHQTTLRKCILMNCSDTSGPAGKVACEVQILCAQLEGREG